MPTSQHLAAQDLSARLDPMRQAAPLVHCLTNTVVQTVTANALLAAGAAPAMVDHPEEAGVFAGVAGGVLINTGTIAPHQVQSMPIAARAANDAGVPWVLDPVAVGFLPVRTGLAADLLELGPTAIRGNASEIAALAGMGEGGRGVDSVDSSEDAIPAAAELARRTGAVVAVSGARDIIVWVEEADGASTGEVRTLAIDSGSDLMPRVIGTGCALGALVAAYLASVAGEGASARLRAAAVGAAHAHSSAAGRIAGRTHQQPGSFAVGWMDALSSLDAAALIHEVSVSEL
ncbi:hydroxyethylthiazole kinase [Helcobacillus massiliensis]|uniref:hydroxyethylthiazole kinase n=1 Tax=Helcobacillus massiliensis TaxID=521392 RepID=UPI0021A842C7|nr:hydroxyethylthiazole kinase [Helcobacillus massiliensis]MCT1557728.1 hydroxyethylthiazole kinase [Helcobacillus massiliensis]MCT2036000.1 hydroxyethylthiazole kinase [Helcobacillus massiliensis]MCT2331730.1 hydroxyethylthiazole kinase [Helcobacillus massiliensis]